MRQIGKFAALVLYLLLAACLSLAVLAAAAGYSEAVELYDMGSDARVLGQFARTRVRQCDSGGVSASDGMASMLEVYPEGEFLTGLYYYNGWVMEQLYVPSVPFDPAMGNKILQAGMFHAQPAPGGIYIDTEYGRHYLYIRSGGDRSEQGR